MTVNFSFTKNQYDFYLVGMDKLYRETDGRFLPVPFLFSTRTSYYGHVVFTALVA